jgi:putative flippase GtrA
MADAEAPPAASPALLARTGVRQFVKFCIIGFTSMILDVGISYGLTYGIHWNWKWARILSFGVAVTNGFIWNSLWTFRGLGSGGKHQQYAKFVAVNIVGLLLNLAIMKAVFLVVTGRLINQGNPDPFHWKIAMALAVVCVSLWNFFANKHYTFRPSPEAD